MQAVPQLTEFIHYARTLQGDEKGEAQVFCDRLFRAFGHAGYKEAGATLEERVKGAGKRTRFVDLVWRPRLLLEMKSRGEKLQRHYRQAFEYWVDLVPHRPRYVVLCNFDEFWIYDFDRQVDEPVDRVPLEDLSKRFTALNFLFPHDPRPQFGNDRVAVTRAAAAKVAEVFNAMIARGEDRDQAQRFILQSVVAMFSEDFDLLPRGLFTELLDDCLAGDSSYDLVGGLFRQMNDSRRARGGRFRDVAYFDGGLFARVDAIDLTPDELRLLKDAAGENDWSRVQPPIFGTLFQQSMGKEARHAYGAHFTSEADIQKVVLPTIVRPWRERVERASTLKQLTELAHAVTEFRVLDPACGSGNFLYIAYRELVGIEMEIIAKIHDQFGRKARQAIGTASLVSSQQFYGIDNNSFAVELAKVTLMLGKRLALAEARKLVDATQRELPLIFEEPLPLDNLDENIRCDDALFCPWPEVDAIIGNPPYQSKNKMQQEYGPAYLNRIRNRYRDVPGRADYCVYWFRRAHDELPANGRAGLVGTNTIRQNYSRQGGLDYIVGHGGTITEAVSTQVWSGDAVVHVSIANWVKGNQLGRKRLYTQVGDDATCPWTMVELDSIPSSLSPEADVTDAITLTANSASDACAQGQTHGHEAFLLTPDEGRAMIRESKRNSEVILPYLIGDDLLGSNPPRPQRMVIDFHPRDVFAAKAFAAAFQHIQAVLPARKTAAKEEERRNNDVLSKQPKARVNHHHANFLKRWWLLSYPREELIRKLATIPRYVVCSRVTRRPVFEFVDHRIRPGDSLQVFALPDDYSFGILQSAMHWQWFTYRCSTFKGDPRYTSNSVFDTFPWPQKPKPSAMKEVARTGRQLRALRTQLLDSDSSLTLRDLYRTLELPGANRLKDAHTKLDAAVHGAYGIRKSEDVLHFLLKLNHELADRESRGMAILGPGLPPAIEDFTPFTSADCISP